MLRKINGKQISAMDNETVYAIYKDTTAAIVAQHDLPEVLKVKGRTEQYWREFLAIEREAKKRGLA